MEDITNLISTIFTFLFSTQYAVFGIPLIFYLTVPIILALIFKLIKRGH